MANNQLNENQQKLYNLAVKHHEDPAKWLALYKIESSSGENLYGKRSNAVGHFQIMPQFFKDYNIDEKGAMDLEKSFIAVKEHHEKHSATLRKQLGRELTAGEYYLGHQQGWAGATKLLSNPDKNVVDVLTSSYKNDQHKSARQKAIDAVIKNGGNVNMTAGQFAHMWIDKADRYQQEYIREGYGQPNKNGSLEQQNPNSLNVPSIKKTSKNENEYDETMAMIQSIIKDSTGARSKEIADANPEVSARFEAKVSESIERDKQQVAAKESESMGQEHSHRVRLT